MADLVKVPIDFEGDLPGNFYSTVVDMDDDYYYGEWTDNDGNGIADFVDAYHGDPDTELPKSHEHTGT